MTTEQMRHRILEKIYEAAVEVCQWTYDDMDEEPKNAMTNLMMAVEAMEKLDELETIVGGKDGN